MWLHQEFSNMSMIKPVDAGSTLGDFDSVISESFFFLSLLLFLAVLGLH